MNAFGAAGGQAAQRSMRSLDRVKAMQDTLIEKTFDTRDEYRPNLYWLFTK